MEFKVEQQILRLQEELKTETAEHSMESELILPDHYEDMGRILKCKGEPQILAATVNGKTLTVEGVLCMELLYVNQQGGICFFTQSIPFYHEAAAPEENCLAEVNGTMDFCNCRGVNQRKVEIRGAVSLKIRYCKINDLTVITDALGGGVQLEKTQGEVSTLVAAAEKPIGITDEIQLDSGSIRNVFRCKGIVCDVEQKIINGRVMIKGNLEINTLYQELSGRYCPFQTKLPFSSVIDMDGVDTDCYCPLAFSVTHLELRPRTGLDGECKTLMIQASLCVRAKAYRTLSLPLITDGFSTACGLGLRKYGGNLPKLWEVVEKSHLCKKQLDLEREIKEVVDLGCHVTSHRVQWEKNKMTVSGILTLYLVTLDGDNLPVYTEKQMDYHFEHSCKEGTEPMTCHPTVTVTDLAYSLASDTMVDLRIHLFISASVFQLLPCHPVVELTVDSTATVPPCPAPLVVYFAQEGEPIFQIARKYSTTCKAILEANNLTEPCAPGGALLVPACKE